MALVCGLYPVKEGILAVSCALLLPGLGFETFVDFTQTDEPRGCPDWGAGGSFLCFSLSRELGVPDPD